MTLTLAPEAVSAIVRHCVDAPGVETGGVLAEVDGVIRFASGPGPDAELQPAALQWDPAYIARWMRGCAEISGGRTLGRWHKHTVPSLAASETDRAGAAALRDALGHPAVVDLIVACADSDAPAGWRAYVCTRTEYTMIECEIPGITEEVEP